MSSHPRIVFTSSGAVCGGGLSVNEIWENVKAGQSAVGPLQQWNAENWPVRIAAELRGVNNRSLVADRKLHKFVSRTDLLGLCAADQAIAQSGLLAHRATLNPEATARFNDRTGVFDGSGGGNYSCNYDFFPLLTEARGNLRRFGQELDNTVNPMWLLRNLPNNVLCHVGILHNFKGTNACVTNHCIGGVAAVAEAANAIRAGEADRAVATGHDAPIDAETLVNFERVGLLAREALRPFDADRDGTVLGEGAASFTLEKLEDAQSRRAPVLGEFLGSGTTTEATGVLDLRPDGEGMARAIHLALRDAQLGPESIGMIVAHANGTRSSDASEVMGLRRVFGNGLPPITGFKWAIGHTIAASGVIDVALALKGLEESLVPGIPTLRELDPALSPLSASAREQEPSEATALVLCRGFGGMNMAVIVGAAPVSSGE